MHLRSRLFQLVAGTVAPLFLLATILGLLLASYQQTTFRDGAIARIRAFMTAVDAELRGHVRALTSLAAERSLSEDELPAFYEDAGRVLRAQPEWINITLSRPDGQQILNLAEPFGAVLARNAEMESTTKVVETLQPAVGSVFRSAAPGTYGVPVRVPVVRGGRLVYILTAVIAPRAFEGLIREQDIPDDWVSGLIDATGHFIARVPPMSHEAVASTDFRGAIRRSREGWYRGLTVEKVDTFTAFKVSDASDWSIGLAIPASDIHAGVWSAAWIIVLGTLAGTAIALVFAYRLGRSITTPISRLAAAARALGAGAPDPQVEVPTGIQELREVGQALSEAASAIRERQALVEREQAALREADRAKDEFLAMLGHELRNPLGALSSAAHVLNRSDGDGPLAAQSRATIERQTRHMTRLVEDLLDISRLTMGKVTLRREPFDLSRLAERVVRTWEQSQRIRPGKVELDLAPVWVDGDRSRVEQVLSNLLENAHKFSPDALPIGVATRREGGEAILEVVDQGEGLPAAMLDRIFGIFVQGPQGPARTRGGMGIGLALVRRLVELHGGRVQAESRGSGRGSRFTVRLAALAEPPPEVKEAPLSVELPPAALRILVTEDNPDARAMMRAMLELDGHEVHVAATGSEALGEASAWSPDLVLMDIGLPDMEGYEVARRMRERAASPRPVLVALTGFGQPEDERRAYDAGFDLHLIKPVEPETLRKILASFARPR